MKYIGLEEAAIQFISHTLTAMFPYHFGDDFDGDNAENKIKSEYEQAKKKLTEALRFTNIENIEKITETVFGRLPEIKEVIDTDIKAAYEGDPAATCSDEIILSYPAFKAISTYRIAHELYMLKVPIIPRMLSEYAHRNTGIDIHPGATIGNYFFIDHGTGVVIGETTTIGEHVKLYQHVTLGAKSFEVGEDGILVKGIKRHPDIGNYVVIYAGATILGGNTRIGDHCVIGGNVWLTHSVEPNETVTIRVYGHDSGENSRKNNEDQKH